MFWLRNISLCPLLNIATHLVFHCNTASVDPNHREECVRLASLLSYSEPLTLLLQIKGGGRAMNPGFSSTNGLQIGMSRSDIEYDHEPP